MPDLPHRTKHESALSAAVASVFAVHKPAGDGRHAVKWDAFRTDLRKAIAPRLAATFATSGDQLNRLHDLGLSDDEVADRARRWSDRYTDTLTRMIADNSRRALEKAQAKQDEIDRREKAGGAALLLMGGTGGGTRPVLSGGGGPLVAASGMNETLDRVFGRDRATNIARTETTRAATHGELGIIAAYALITGSSLAPDGTVLDDPIWNTQEDEGVCFPAGTLIETESGPKPIEAVTTRDRVWARGGLRPVSRCGSREYHGIMTVLKAGTLGLACTSDHRIWTLKQGWRPAGNLDRGDGLEAVGNKHVEVDCIFNFPVGDAHDVPAFAFQIPGFSGILSAASIRVYDISIEDTPEFYANGILVHNCDQCEPLNSTGPEVWQDDFPDGPPAHTNCRCFLTHDVDGDKFESAARESADGSSPFDPAWLAGVAAVLYDYPATRQPNHWSCGAAAAMAAGIRYADDRRTIHEWIAALGTSEANSTPPEAIYRYLPSIGVPAQPMWEMTIEALWRLLRQRRAVICCCQDWGNRRMPGASFAYGHWVTIVGVVPIPRGDGPVDGYLLVQDSSIQNALGEPGGDVPAAEASRDDNMQAPGKVPVTWAEWLRRWHDEDAAGNKYLRFGIAVGPRQEAAECPQGPE